MDNIKELVRKHWDWRATDFDQEASHGLLNDTQAQAWRNLIRQISNPVSLPLVSVQARSISVEEGARADSPPGAVGGSGKVVATASLLHPEAPPALIALTR